MNRRTFLASGATAAAVAALSPQALAEWAPGERIPTRTADHRPQLREIQSIQFRHRTTCNWNALVRRAVYLPRRPLPAWSDIPNDRVMKWEEDRRGERLPQASNKANGATATARAICGFEHEALA